MTCYLCAYKSQWRFTQPHDLPHDSPADEHDALGTCKECSVWACSRHGRLFYEFICAMCVTSGATQDALGVKPDGASAEEVRAYGEDTLEQIEDYADRVEVRVERLQRMNLALAEIANNRRITSNLADFIFDRWGDEVVANGRLPQSYFNIVSGSVRTTFGNRWVSPSPDADEVVFGALSMAYAVADPEASLTRLPWQLANPTLLHTVMWPVAVAYNLPTA
jgi:hypothetical protein